MEPRREIPRECKCWPYWDDETFADPAVCTDFQPNRGDEIFGFPRCANCRHLGACHRRDN